MTSYRSASQTATCVHTGGGEQGSLGSCVCVCVCLPLQTPSPVPQPISPIFLTQNLQPFHNSPLQIRQGSLAAPRPVHGDAHHHFASWAAQLSGRECIRGAALEASGTSGAGKEEKGGKGTLTWSSPVYIPRLSIIERADKSCRRAWGLLQKIQ